MEKRISKRKQVARPAKIYWPDLMPICDCTVSDISDTGVRLNLDGKGNDELPSDFVLSFTPDENPKNSNRSVTRRCRIVWMKNNELGAWFPDRRKLR